MGLRTGYGSKGASSFVPPTTGPSFTAPPVPGSRGEKPDDPGGFSFDFSDPVRSTFENVGEAGRFATSLIPFGNEIGANIVQPFFSGVGDLGLGPGAQLKDLGQAALNIVGGALSAISIPGQMTEEQVARQRIEQHLSLQRGEAGATLGAIFKQLQGGLLAGAAPLSYEPLQGDIAARALAGEDIATLAKEMAAGGRGYSDNLTVQLTKSVIADPLNLLSMGLGAAGKAGTAVRIAQAGGPEVGVLRNVVGRSYNTLAAGGSASVQAVARGVVGPATSGVVRAYGPRRYAGLVGRLGKENPIYRERWDKAFGTYNTQVVRGVAGKNALSGIDEALRPAVRAEQIEENIRSLVEKLPKSGFIRKQIETDAEYLTRLVAPRYLGMADEARYAETATKLAALLDAPVEAVGRILGSKVDLETAQAVHGAFYGKLVDDLATARDGFLTVTRGTAAEVARRWTPLAPDTLTTQRAAAILADEAPEVIVEAVEKYALLGDRFLGGVPYAHADVRKYIKALADNDALPTEMGRNIPKVAQGWRARASAFDYELGLAPKSGWKAVPLDDGTLVMGDPFVHIQAGVTPVGIRNPLGRFGDSLFAAIHQRTIVLASEQRLQRMVVDQQLDVSPAQAVSIHKSILREAADRQITPRALALESAKDRKYASRVSEIFAEHLSETQYAALIEKARPEFLFLRAIEGNVGQVGLTQKFTGAAKARTGKGGRWLSYLSEKAYPELRFRYNPYFQIQEKLETPIWRFARGIKSKVADEMDPLVRRTVEDIFESDENFRFLTEEWSAIYLQRGDEAARQLIAKGAPGLQTKLGNLFNVAGPKREAAVAQAMTEHAEWFEKAMRDIDPQMWARWSSSAGSQEPKAIVAYFIKERQALASVRDADLRRVLDDARRAASSDLPWDAGDIERAYQAGRVAEGQALNRALGVARGGTAESGGAIKAASRAASIDADMETFWQAYVYSLRKSADVARQTQYFRQGRGWLERTLNHPMLGLYPLSYASKVWMEFARFFLVRPFGLKAPLAGLEALNNVQQAILADIETEGMLYDFAAKNPTLMRTLGQMLPYEPTNMSVRAPLWLRDIAGQAEAGQQTSASQRTAKSKNVTPTDFIGAVADDAERYLNPFRFFDTVRQITNEAGASIEESLPGISEAVGELLPE
jgi:hypothetical protein